MTYLELLRTLHDNGATTTASLLAALNDNALLAALGVADTALVDVLKHDINAERICLAILIGDGQNKTEYFATGTACRAYCEAENASIIERDHHGDKDKWLDAAHALEWVPVSVNEWLRYMPATAENKTALLIDPLGNGDFIKTISVPVDAHPLDAEELNKLRTAAGDVKVNKMNLNALLANALGAYELLKAAYPTVKETNGALAANLYSRAEELHLCAQVIKSEVTKGAL